MVHLRLTKFMSKSYASWATNHPPLASRAPCKEIHRLHGVGLRFHLYVASRIQHRNESSLGLHDLSKPQT